MTLRTGLARVVRTGLAVAGYDLVRRSDTESWPHDFDERTIATCRAVSDHTLTSIDRIAALVAAVRHLQRTGVSGAMVECGVWRGGSMMAVARTLLEEAGPARDLWMYDTFTRMPPPGDRDYDVWGRHASVYFEGPVDPHDTEGYRYLPLEQVRSAISDTGYPIDRLHFVAGLIEDTIPSEVPDEIALLRLDTDWYESTRHELTHLYPRLADGAVLIIDDYGQFTGARDAVDEHFATLDPPPMLHRIDWTGRLAVIRR